MAFITAVRNRLVLDFSWKKVRCREYLRLPATREGRTEARRIKKQIEGEIVARTLDYAKWFPDGAKLDLFAPTRETAAAPTFAALAREWLENKKAWFAPATYYDRKRIIEGKLIPFLDDATTGPTSARLVSTIQLEDVERLVNAVKGHEGIHGRKLSNRRANIILDVLRQVLDRAVLRGWLARNPARAVSKLREDRVPIDPFSFERSKRSLRRVSGRQRNSATSPSRSLPASGRANRSRPSGRRSIGSRARRSSESSLPSARAAGEAGPRPKPRSATSRCSRWSSTRFASSGPRASCGAATSSRAAPVGR